MKAGSLLANGLSLVPSDKMVLEDVLNPKMAVVDQPVKDPPVGEPLPDVALIRIEIERESPQLEHEVVVDGVPVAIDEGRARCTPLDRSLGIGPGNAKRAKNSAWDENPRFHGIKKSCGRTLLRPIRRK